MKLDAEQKKIEKHLSGNALVLAGAGSGKTACCVARVVNLIKNGVPPKRILLLTFTNKAAREMRGRILEALDGISGAPNTTTFHSFGYRFIRKNYAACNRQSWPSMLDAFDAKKLLKDSLSEAGANTKDAKKLETLMKAIELFESAGIDFPVLGEKEEDRKYFHQIAIENNLDDYDLEHINNAMKIFNDKKTQQNVIDFNDLINLPRRALEKDKDLREKVGQFIIDITVDEAQDNNLAQYKLIKMLKSPTNHIMMVGDDDQSIYQFRGAAPECMFAYQQEFNPTIYRLERNYRSHPDIVDKASSMIRLNNERLEKRPFSALDGNNECIVGWLRHRTDKEMVNKIVQSIKHEYKNGASFNDIAILYRINAMSRLFEKKLLAEGIPYVIRKTTSVLERKEIKLLTAVIRLVHNRKDGLAFSEAASVIQGLGEKRIESLRESGQPFNSGLVNKKIQAQLDQLEKHLDLLAEKGPRHLLKMTDKGIDIRTWLRKRAETAIKAKNKKEGADDQEFGKQVNEKIREYVGNMKLLQESINARLDALDDYWGELTIEEQWEEAMEIISEPPEESIDDDKKNVRGRVTLSSGHNSKGLEWPVVYIAGMSNGIMPLNNSDLEEERRLAYVMMTRAKNKIVAHHADEIFIHGEVKEYTPSRFIEELNLSALSALDDDVSLMVAP